MLILSIFAATKTACQELTQTDCVTNFPTPKASGANLQHLIQIALGSMAAVAVLIIVLAGLSFITAQGDPQKVARAREAIIYALIGLAVAVSAELLVTFVLGKV